MNKQYIQTNQTEKKTTWHELKHMLTSNYIQWADAAIQKVGLSMGNPISPLSAIIYMYDLEKTILNRHNDELVWWRYIDDVFFAIRNDWIDPEDLLQEINAINEHIKFTIELPAGNSMPFLDFEITYQDEIFSHKLYSKGFHSNVILPFSSAISKTTKKRYRHRWVTSRYF